MKKTEGGGGCWECLSMQRGMLGIPLTGAQQGVRACLRTMAAGMH